MINTMPSWLKKFTNRHRKLILLMADFFLVSISYLSVWGMLNGRISLAEYLPTLLASWLVYMVIFLIVFVAFGMYESLWRYAEAYEFTKCMLASLTASAVFTGLTLLFIRPPWFASRVPLSVYFLSALLAGMVTLFLRMFYRVWRNARTGTRISSGRKKVMVVGAGQTSNQVVQDIHREPDRKYDVVCIVDDDPDKIGRKMQRIRVMGPTKDIPKLVERYGIEVIILAIFGAPAHIRREITHICSKTKCQLKKVPDLYAFVTDSASLAAQIKDVSVEDLLGRDVVDIRPREGEYYMEGQTVLVTGAGGTIGSELCRQIVLQNPQRLVLVDNYENGLYEIQQEILHMHRDKITLHAEVATVRDEGKIDLLFQRYKPDIVFHAAAHKHVPLMESAPEEAVKNNIFGTLNTARAADRYGVKKFVLISTDKAVNPTNVMGATKRVCELIAQCMNKLSKTEFVAVRFGNVLGSNGSVIPFFKEQIRWGGPVTVTHPEIIRYFMTIPEAVSLVLTAGRMAQGGEIFVLDMGEPVKILDLAESLIRMSGYEPGREIEIVFTGLRPGEKLYEELLLDEEGLLRTANKKIFVGTALNLEPEVLFAQFERLREEAFANDSNIVVDLLHELVPGFGKRQCAMKADQI